MDAHIEEPGSTGCKLLAGYEDQHKGFKELTESGLLREYRSGSGMLWAHMTVEDCAGAKRFLIEQMRFHELAVEDALSEHERGGVQFFSDHLFVGVPTITFGKDGIELQEVGIFVGKRFLVTVVNHATPWIEEWFERWNKAPDRIGSNPSALLYVLLDAVVDAYFVASDQLEEAIDQLSDDIFQGKGSPLRQALDAKKTLLKMRRAATYQREALNTLLRSDNHLIDREARIYFQDVYDHSLRILETIDISRDTVTTALDAHLAMVSNNLTVVMRTLTVIATVLMTMSLVAGIYGMNFVFMPELKWRYGFAYALALMATLAALEIWYFKRKRFF